MASVPSNTGDAGDIRVRVVHALQRAERLTGGEPLSERPIEPLLEATTAVAAAAAELLDEFLERLVTERQRSRSSLVDRMHAAASAAAGELRGVLRTMRTLHPDQGSDYATGCRRARDDVASIGSSAGTELAIEEPGRSVDDSEKDPEQP